MADNYLEKQRELYEARKAAWEKTRRSKKRKVQNPKTVSSPSATPSPVPSDETDKENIK